MVMGVNTYCKHCGTPMQSCTIPGDCGCTLLGEIMEAAEKARADKAATEIKKAVEELERTEANKRQVGGNHYKTKHGIEHWDLVAMFDWDYFQAQIIKYIMRWKKKGGVKDLEKAAHNLQKYIELVTAGIYKMEELPNEPK